MPTPAFHVAHVAHDAAPLLPRQLEDAQFQLLSALTGQPEQSPRWKRCVAHTVAALGDLVGQAFVRDRLGGTSKAAAEGQIHAIVAARARQRGAVGDARVCQRVRLQGRLEDGAPEAVCPLVAV